MLTRYRVPPRIGTVSSNQPETMNIFIGLIIGIGILLVIAFPERFLPSGIERKKRVGANYWAHIQALPSLKMKTCPLSRLLPLEKRARI